VYHCCSTIEYRTNVTLLQYFRYRNITPNSTQTQYSFICVQCVCMFANVTNAYLQKYRWKRMRMQLLLPHHSCTKQTHHKLCAIRQPCSRSSQTKEMTWPLTTKKNNVTLTELFHEKWLKCRKLEEMKVATVQQICNAVLK